MKIKTRLYLTLVRMAIIKKSTNSKYWRGCGEIGTFLHCWQVIWTGVATMESSMEVSLKTKKRVTMWVSFILFLGIYKQIALILKDTCPPVFITALITIAKTWKQRKCPLADEWIKKMWHIYKGNYKQGEKTTLRMGESNSKWNNWQRINF